MRWCLLVVLLACTPARDVEVRIRLAAAVARAEDVRFEPRGHVRALRLDDRGWLQVSTDGAALTAHIPGHCPVHLEQAAELVAQELFSYPETLAQVGYDAAFAVRVEPGCPEAEAADLRWSQVEGLPLAQLEARGRELHARTLPLAAYLSGPWPPGVVAVSPRTQGRYVLEAIARVAGREPARLRVTVTSIARATGLSSLAVSQRVMLGGDGWRVLRAPPGASPELQLRDGVVNFAADVPGRYLLANAAGEQLEAQALTHDHTPMDCGRAECHASISSGAETTPMSHAFELPFAHGVPAESASCMLDCHVVGEPGLSDGGFCDLARSLGEQATGYAQLPHALQRLAGVRCTSCHGPGAIPSQGGRARILRASVCATCHDSPPAYRHVAEWQSSRMARSDRDPASRQSLRCARCHTTGGFLHQQGERVRADWSLEANVEVGISCAACHTPHGPALGHGLVRSVQTPASLAAPGARSAACVSCHAPLPDELTPSASSAVLVQGQLRLPESLGGELLAGARPHAELAGGCVACHGKRAGEALDHSFRVDSAVCTSCHQARQPAELHTRAEAVLRALEPRCPSSHTGEPASPCASRALNVARYAARLVFDDRGAAAHNAPFARQLLELAERSQ
jgi:Cytochrome c7 and related cytochrome c